jgi:hypothetical protein
MDRMRQCLALAAGAMIGAAGAVAGLGWGQPDPTQPTQPTPPSNPSNPNRLPGTNPDRQPTYPGNPNPQPGTNPDRQPGSPLNPDYPPGKPGYTQPSVPSLNLGNKLTRDQVDKIINTWPAESKKAAQATLDKYGPPDGSTPQELIWQNAGPWKKVVVMSVEVPHNFPITHKDCIMGFVDMKIPVDKVGDVARFDGSICCMRTAGMIGSCCNSEEMNFAALNLAHDVIDGSKSAEEAREQLAKVAMGYKQGTKDPITQGFTFPVEKGMTGDPDQQAHAGNMPDTTDKPLTPGGLEPKPTGRP